MDNTENIIQSRTRVSEKPAFAQGVAEIPHLIKALVSTLIASQSFEWNLIYPSSIGSVSDVAIISTTTTFNKTFYIMFKREKLNEMEIKIGTALNDAQDDLADLKQSEWTQYSWYTENITLYEWLPVEYLMNFNQDSINIVLQGDATLDTLPYNNYLISYCYIGSLLSYDGATVDEEYNFVVTSGAANAPTDHDTFGVHTANGVTDIAAVGTFTGVPYQSHNVGQFTDNQFGEKHILTSSRYTGNYHFSEVVVMHHVDGVRGKLQNVIIGDKFGITHRDELYSDRGTEDEKIYLMVNVNAPYSFIGNSGNIFHGLALRKI
ncbi:MAG: hypothetical protein ATN35_02165 [Epulopiscium sp. Nele67-Bin004]|nr:MAG: hypothetical protein ATN35_02165 [Epulopiscium sp. Nele67-Bin004]